MDYKQTLNLPQTGFPMKAGLVEREPERLASWYKKGIYECIRKRHAKALRTTLSTQNETIFVVVLRHLATLRTFRDSVQILQRLHSCQIRL